MFCENFIWIEPLLRGHLSCKAILLLPKRWPLKTGLTLFNMLSFSTDDGDIVINFNTYCIQILTMSFINHNKEVIKLIQHLNQFNQKLKVIRTSFYLIKGCRWIIPLIQPPPKSKLFHSQKSINNLYLSLNKVHKATLIHLTKHYYDTTYWSLIKLVKYVFVVLSTDVPTQGL